MPSQLSSQSQILRGITNKNVGCGVDNHETNFKKPCISSKKERLVEEPYLCNKMPSASNSGIHACEQNFSEDNMLTDVVPDVAAAIEDLLEQTSKVQELFFFIYISLNLFYCTNGQSIPAQLVRLLLLTKMHGQRSPAQTGYQRGVSL